MPKLSVSVMHSQFYPGRRALLMGLQRKLGPDFRNRLTRFKVVNSNQAEPVVLVSLRAWDVGLVSGSDFHIVFQDDAGPCKDFIEAARIIASLVPNNPVTFFCNGKFAEGMDAGARWAAGVDATWGVALMLPNHLLRRYVVWARKMKLTDETMTGDDMLLAAFCIYHGIEVFCTLPSLVEHDAWDKPSMLGYRPPHANKARRMIPDGVSALSINWAQGLDKPIRVPYTTAGDYATIMKNMPKEMQQTKPV